MEDTRFGRHSDILFVVRGNTVYCIPVVAMNAKAAERPLCLLLFHLGHIAIPTSETGLCLRQMARKTILYITNAQRGAESKFESGSRKANHARICIDIRRPNVAPQHLRASVNLCN